LKNVSHAVEHCAEREAKGPFRELRDFAQRIDPHAVNKRALETLAASGALEELGVDRATAFANVDRILALAQQAHRDKEAGQGALFSSPMPPPGQSNDQARGKQDFPQAKLWCRRPAFARIPGGRLSPAIRSTTTGDVLEALGAETG
jgi:DNA polymerase III alpha subunit